MNIRHVRSDILRFYIRIIHKYAHTLSPSHTMHAQKFHFLNEHALIAVCPFLAQQTLRWPMMAHIIIIVGVIALSVVRSLHFYATIYYAELDLFFITASTVNVCIARPRTCSDHY